MSETVEVKVNLPKPPEGMEWHHEAGSDVFEDSGPNRARGLTALFALRPIAPATVTLTVKRETAEGIVTMGELDLRPAAWADLADAARAALAAEGEPCGVPITWGLLTAQWIEHLDAACSHRGDVKCSLPKHGPAVAHRPEAQR